MDGQVGWKLEGEGEWGYWGGDRQINQQIEEEGSGRCMGIKRLGVDGYLDRVQGQVERDGG